MTLPADPHFNARARDSFARQKAMTLIGASLRRVESGAVEIELPFRDDLTQQSLMPARGSLVARGEVEGRAHAYRGARRGVRSGRQDRRHPAADADDASRHAGLLSG